MARLVRRLGPALLILSLLLTGCRPAPKAHEQHFTAMDTYMHFTAYGQGASAALAQAQEEVLRLESLLSATDAQSEVYALNHRRADTVTLSPDTAALLAFSLEMAAQTGGAVDPTVYPVVSAWGFTASAYRVPEEDELAALLPLVDYTALTLEGQTLTLKEGMELDFGGIAKGWAGDRVLELCRRAGITSCILRLGGNIQTLGTKPDGSPWMVGIQDPNSGGTLATLSVSGLSVVTSGSYERSFTWNGQLYHHIMDPSTGSPARSGLTSVTVVGPSGARCDALSTALFVMGLEQGAQFWREHRDFEAVFVSEDGSTAITAGLEDIFTLSDSQERTVEVLR